MHLFKVLFLLLICFCLIIWYNFQCYIHFYALFFPDFLFLHLQVCRWSLVVLASTSPKYSWWFGRGRESLLTWSSLFLKNSHIFHFTFREWNNFFSTSIRMIVCNYHSKPLDMQIFSPEHSILSPVPLCFFFSPLCAHLLSTNRKISIPSLYQNFSGQFLY